MNLIAEIPYTDVDATIFGKLLVVSVINLVVPMLLRNRIKPASRLVAFIFYVLIVYPANIVIASIWGIQSSSFLYFVGGVFFLFYWIHMLSVGYTSKRDVQKTVQVIAAKNNMAAQDSLNMAVKLLAVGKKETAIQHFNEISKFFPGSMQADMAKQYLAEINSQVE